MAAGSTDVDVALAACDEDGGSIVARAAGRVAGRASYTRVYGPRAALSIEVDDAYWHRGLPGVLIDALAARAARVGIMRFLLRVPASDVRLLALLREDYATRERRDGAFVDVECDTAERPGSRGPSPVLRHDDARAGQASATKVGECLVDSLVRVRRHMRADRHARRELEELRAVGAGEVRDRAQDALVPEALVAEGRDVAHVDATADDGAAGHDGIEGDGHERPVGREDDRRVERHRGALLRSSRPDGTELAGERLRRLVAPAREREHLATLVARDLGEDVRGRAKAVEAEPRARSQRFSRPPVQ
jgi:hypothetical protein